MQVFRRVLHIADKCVFVSVLRMRVRGQLEEG